jgi:FkbM family methyltransferase
MYVQLYGKQLNIGPNPSALCQRRWLGKLSPEPETVAWIESLRAGEIFFDVGANVGTFSVRAALRGLKVFSFEPVLQHYWELCTMLELNPGGLDVSAYHVALSDAPTVGIMGRGRSTHTLHHGTFGAVGTVAFALNDLAELLGVYPHHVKIDVDGDEPRVLKGMYKLLPTIKSLLVEVDPQMPDHLQIPSFLNSYGFTWDPAQVDACRINGGKYDGTANWIFKK